VLEHVQTATDELEALTLAVLEHVQTATDELEALSLTVLEHVQTATDQLEALSLTVLEHVQTATVESVFSADERRVVMTSCPVTRLGRQHVLQDRRLDLTCNTATLGRLTNATVN